MTRRRYFALLLAPLALGLCASLEETTRELRAGVPVPGAAALSSCDEELAPLIAALDATAEPNETEANDVASHARSLALKTDPRCAEAARDVVLARSRTCGRARQAITAGLFVGDAFEAAWTARILDASSVECLRQTLPSVQYAYNADGALLATVERLTHHEERAVRGAAWLTLGSITRTARARGAEEVAARGEAIVQAEIERSPGADAIEVAGNAGCRRCSVDFARAALSAEPRIRRAAAAAWRFVPGGARSMCAALSDPDALVREQAAWALRWGEDEREVRAECLRRAAADGAGEVRREAAESLDLLTRTP